MKTTILILILNIAALAQFTASGRVTALDGHGLGKVRIFVTNSCGIEPTATMTSSFGYYEVETPECSIFAVIAEVKAHEFSPTERWYVFIGKQQVNLYNANFTEWDGESLLIPEYRVVGWK